MNLRRITFIITCIAFVFVICIGILLISLIYLNQTITTNNANNGGTLTVVTTSSSGWTRTQPTPTTDNYKITATSQTIQLNSEYTGMKTTLTVNDINSNSIELSTGILGAIGLKQGDALFDESINLNSCGPQTFTIKRNEKVELYTCTMDAGTTWELTYN